MSDVANASSNEASENVSVSSDQVSSDAPDEQSSEPKPSGSTREALERALATVEPQPQQQATDGKPRERTPDGKFAPNVKQVELQPGKPGEPVKVVDAAQQQPLQQQVPGQAPSRFTKAAQEAWATTPEPVKVEVERAITELTQGIEKYKGDAEAHQPFKQFAELAKQNNVEPVNALRNYVEIDRLLASDPLNGLLQVCQKTNINPVAAAQAILKQYGGPQEQGGPPEIAQLQQIIGQLNNEIAGLKGQFGNFTQTYQQQQQQAHYNSHEQAVISFAADKPYFAEIAPTIERLLATGFTASLQEAHDAALRLNPEVQSRIEQSRTAQAAQPDPAQTQAKASKSITGTPSNGSNPATRKASGSPRESINNAFAQLGI